MDTYKKVFNIDFNLQFDVVMCSSMGGMVAYVVSELKNSPCLLFNPALYTNSLGWDIDQMEAEPATKPRNKPAYIVLGAKDDVVVFNENLEYITKNVSEPKKVLIEPTMSHRVPLDIFEKHVELFFQHIEAEKLLI